MPRHTLGSILRLLHIWMTQHWQQAQSDGKVEVATHVGIVADTYQKVLKVIESMTLSEPAPEDIARKVEEMLDVETVTPQEPDLPTAEENATKAARMLDVDMSDIKPPECKLGPWESQPEPDPESVEDPGLEWVVNLYDTRGSLLLKDPKIGAIGAVISRVEQHRADGRIAFFAKCLTKSGWAMVGECANIEAAKRLVENNLPQKVKLDPINTSCLQWEYDGYQHRAIDADGVCFGVILKSSDRHCFYDHIPRVLNSSGVWVDLGLIRSVGTAITIAERELVLMGHRFLDEESQS